MFNIYHRNQDYILRLATDNDVAGIRILASEQTTRERMAKARTFVLVLDKEIVGTINFYEANLITNRRTASVTQFAITQRLRRSGLGSILMDFCEELANDEKYEGIQLDIEKPAMHLVNWFKKRGYKIVGETQGEGKANESWVFEKTLRAAFVKN